MHSIYPYTRPATRWLGRYFPMTMIKLDFLRSIWVVLLTCGLLAACADQEEVPRPANYGHIGQFDTVAVHIISGTDTVRVQAELAETEDQRQLGEVARSGAGRCSHLGVLVSIFPASSKIHSTSG